jgi:hypothetical protein
MIQRTCRLSIFQVLYRGGWAPKLRHVNDWSNSPQLGEWMCRMPVDNDRAPG